MAYKLDILGRLYRLTTKKHRKTLGLTDWNKGTINVNPGQQPFDLRDTLLHEVMHAIRFQQGHDTAAKEEPYVQSLATGLIAVFDANPELAAYIAGLPAPD